MIARHLFGVLKYQTSASQSQPKSAKTRTANKPVNRNQSAFTDRSNLPYELNAMGNYQATPKLDKESNKHGRRKAYQWAASSMQGWPTYNEDRLRVEQKITDEVLKDASFFAIFDGHAGKAAAEYCKDNLLENIIECLKVQQAEKPPHSPSNGQRPAKRTKVDISRAIKEGFIVTDEKLRGHLTELGESSGTTVVCAVLTRSHIFLAHCGDSRALLVSEDAEPIVTADHKPDNEMERERIKKAGGLVMNHRVNGLLAVSRALGDFEYKWHEDGKPEDQAVSGSPDIITLKMTEKEQFLVLACDGVWDLMANEAVATYVDNRLRCTKDMANVCDQLIETALFKGSRDNLTAIVVCFNKKNSAEKDDPLFNKRKVAFDKAARKADKDVDLKLKEAVDKALEEPDAHDSIQTVTNLMALLANVRIDKLPPGGGLPSKRRVVQQRFDERLPQKGSSSYPPSEPQKSFGAKAVFQKEDEQENATSGHQNPKASDGAAQSAAADAKPGAQSSSQAKLVRAPNKGLVNTTPTVGPNPRGTKPHNKNAISADSLS